MPEAPIILKPVWGNEELLRNLTGDRKRQYREHREVEENVRAIIERVMDEGDQACRELTLQYDRVTLDELQVPREQIERARESLAPPVLEALEHMIEGVRNFHLNQRERSWWAERSNATLGEVIHPVGTVAAYIPGGRYPYPSSVVMTVVPAQIARVPRIYCLTPPGRFGSVAPEILATASLLGVEAVYRLGGAQAIAASCFGTETVPRADLIVGPGNQYVTAAKKLLQGTVGIDNLAGPSEVVIVAEPPANPGWVALDLLAQAEHDPLALSMILSPNEGFLVSVKAALERELASQPLPFDRKVPIYLLQTQSRDQALTMAGELAPEHLEIMLPDASVLPPGNTRAGAVFTGERCCVALGDYGFGPNHVIPTGGGCRFASPLSVRDFMTASSFISMTGEESSTQHGLYARLAGVEGLVYHEKSLLARIGRSTLPEWNLDLPGKNPAPRKAKT